MSRRKKTDQAIEAEVTEAPIEANGVISVRRSLESRKAVFRWEGGPVARCATSVLMLGLRGFVRREGDILWVGPFRTRVLREEPDYIYLERVSE